MITLTMIIGVVFFFLVFLRVWWVWEYRAHILDLIEEALHADIEGMDIIDLAFVDTNKRHRVFHSIPMYVMVWKFWKPVHKFYTTGQMRQMIY